MSAGRGLLVTNKIISDSNKTGYEATINTIYSNWGGGAGFNKRGRIYCTLGSDSD